MQEDILISKKEFNIGMLMVCSLIEDMLLSVNF